MGGNPDKEPAALALSDAQRQRMIDALTITEKNMLILAESAAMLVGLKLPEAAGEVSPAVAQVKAQLEKRRRELLALPMEQLQVMYQQRLAADAERDRQNKATKAARLAEQASKKEAAKFYNQRSAMADLDHWAKAAYWTLDEALALLLGREPNVLTVQAVQKELAGSPRLLLSEAVSPSPFIAQYLRLRNLAVRALEGARLVPASVVEWAVRSGAVQPPLRLVELLAPAASAAPAGLAAPAPSAPARPADERSTGTTKTWTDERLDELAAYRKKHGTKAAAEHFGISVGRVRQLLPSKATGHNVFTHRLK
jgi:hypothetical protein